MPPNTVKCSRPSKWGNPFRIGNCVHKGPKYSGRDMEVRNAAHACALYKDWLFNQRDALHKVHELQGKNLACWCRLCPAHKDGKPLDVECSECEPCHVDVLGRVIYGR